MYSHLLSKCFKKVIFWSSANYFLTTNRNIFAGKFVNWENFLAVIWEHIIFNFKGVEIRIMCEVFLSEAVLQNERSFSLVFIGFEIFCYKIWNIKTLMMSIGTCRLKLYVRNNIFKKRITYMRFWMSYM